MRWQICRISYFFTILCFHRFPQVYFQKDTFCLQLREEAAVAERVADCPVPGKKQRRWRRIAPDSPRAFQEASEGEWVQEHCSIASGRLPLQPEASTDDAAAHAHWELLYSAQRLSPWDAWRLERLRRRACRKWRSLRTRPADDPRARHPSERPRGRQLGP